MMSHVDIVRQIKYTVGTSLTSHNELGSCIKGLLSVHSSDSKSCIQPICFCGGRHQCTKSKSLCAFKLAEGSTLCFY